MIYKNRKYLTELFSWLYMSVLHPGCKLFFSFSPSLFASLNHCMILRENVREGASSLIVIYK